MAAQHKTTTNSLYFAGLVLLAVSLPLSKFTTGLFQFFLIFVWLFWGLKFKSQTSLIQGALLSFSQNFIEKTSNFGKNKTALLISSLYLLYLTGLLRGGDFNYVLTDLRIKLPLLIIPLILAGLPSISNKQFRILLWIYAAAVLIGTIFSAYVLFTKSFTDIREISLFISPVRFALTICLAIVILFNSIIKNEVSDWKIKSLFAAIILWYLFMLLKLESGIGLVIIATLILFYFLSLIFKSKNNLLKIGLGLAIVIGILLTGKVVQNEINAFHTTPKIDYAKLEQLSPSGNAYIHDTSNYLVEDGRYIGLFLCETELAEAWNKRSNINYQGMDKKGQALRSTLIRFLTSKDLRKDKDGVQSLTTEEIKFIENGIANANYVYHSGLKSRISKIMFGYQVYQETADPGVNSLTLRLTHWKASIGIIKNNLLFGVGTGKIPEAFNEQYEQIAPNLAPEKRMESHNQYLHVLLNLGMVGFGWFMFALIYPVFQSRKFYDFNYMAFLIIIFISMLSEDTLETQSGVTFFAFFNSLFLLRPSIKPNQCN